MVGFDLECLELAGKLAIEDGTTCEQSEDSSDEKPTEEKKPSANEKESDSEKIIDLENLRLTDQPKNSKPKIEELN